MEATIFDIQRSSYADGPGIRTTVFFKGCNLRCKWCHNPESQSADAQMLFYGEKCTQCGKCKAVCPHHAGKCDLCGKCTVFCPKDARQVCGKTYTAEQLLAEVAKDQSYYETSGGGVTFSGGECMLQIDFLTEVLIRCKENGIHTAVDTAGDVPWRYFEQILPYTDLFLYDVKCLTEELHVRGTGVSNGRILQNLTYLSYTFRGEIVVRVPVVKGFNATVGEMEKIADFLKTVRIRRTELLPYHKMGEHKYGALGREEIPFEVPTAEELKIFETILNGKSEKEGV